VDKSSSTERVTQEAFDRLLDWLGADRERAGAKYEHIRRALIEMFTRYECSDANGLADETIHRVTNKVSEIADSYEGDPAHYFFAVARNVFFESRRQKKELAPPPTVPPAVEEAETEELRYTCLDKCLRELSPDKRELILKYYQEVRQARIDNRKQLAETLGVTPIALRVHAHRIRSALEKCIRECLQDKDLKS
jgi:RNA polymerase sigma factor (sigma-70 family)